MKSAYLVYGTGESTGCRAVSKFILSADKQIRGTDKHTQEFQNVMYDDNGFRSWVIAEKIDKLLVRQSYPHGSNLPRLDDWYNRLIFSGFDKVYTIITTRFWPSQIVSTIKNLHIKNNPVNTFLSNPTNRIKTAYIDIFSSLSKINNGKYYDFVVLNIGDICRHPKVSLEYLFKSIDIEPPKNFDFSIVKNDIDINRISEYIKNGYDKV
jgi:hypothetical protein